MTRVATTRGEADADEDGRGVSAPPHNTRIPFGVYGKKMEVRDRFAFSGWTVNPMCALNIAEEAVDAGEDRFEIALTGEA